MKSRNSRAVITRALLLGLSSVLAAAAFLATTAADAAWQYKRDLDTSGNFTLHEASAVAVDRKGDVFITDTGAHRVLKFGADGKRKPFGSVGSGKGQLLYPEGVAVQDIQPGTTWVYVADQGNQRISVFNDAGHFVKTFGDGKLNNPIGVGVYTEIDGSAGNVYVAEDPTHEISVFSPRGDFRRSFTCAACPEGPIHRLGGGIAFYQHEDGSLEVYATDGYYDGYHGRVLVMDPLGVWQRSLGSDSGASQLGLPYGVAEDPLDNTTWAVDSGNSKLLRFDATGTVLTSYAGVGPDQLNDPKGIALYTVPRTTGQPALMYLVNTNAGKVHVYKEEPGKLAAATARTQQDWSASEKAFFTLTYNGIEQSCTSTGALAHVVVDDGGDTPVKFTLNSSTISGPITNAGAELQMDISAARMNHIRRAWAAGKQIKINLERSAKCQDDSTLDDSSLLYM